MRVINFDQLEKIKRERYRLAFKTILNLREGAPRTTSRSINETLRLGAIAQTLTHSYLEVVKWSSQGERILRLKM